MRRCLNNVTLQVFGWASHARFGFDLAMRIQRLAQWTEVPFGRQNAVSKTCSARCVEIWPLSPSVIWRPLSLLRASRRIGNRGVERLLAR